MHFPASATLSIALLTVTLSTALPLSSSSGDSIDHHTTSARPAGYPYPLPALSPRPRSLEQGQEKDKKRQAHTSSGTCVSGTQACCPIGAMIYDPLRCSVVTGGAGETGSGAGFGCGTGMQGFCCTGSTAVSFVFFSAWMVERCGG